MLKIYFISFTLFLIIQLTICGFESHTSPLPEGQNLNNIQILKGPSINQNSEEIAATTDDEDSVAQGDESLMQEWEQHMNDFVPTDMLTFTVEHRSKETLFEDILKMPQLLRGAFFLTSDDNAVINFKILDPQQKTIFIREKTKETIFHINITIPGTYSFIFSNDQFMESKSVTFAAQYGTDSSKLSESDISPIESRILKIDKGVEDIRFETRFTKKRQEQYQKTCISTRKRIFLFTIIETLAIFGTSFWQISYIKKMLDNRRIV